MRAMNQVFTDRPLPGDHEPRNPNHHRVILALSTAFWDAYLRNDASALAWLNGWPTFGHGIGRPVAAFRPLRAKLGADRLLVAPDAEVTSPRSPPLNLGNIEHPTSNIQ
jgi:hypothetical protein